MRIGSAFEAPRQALNKNMERMAEIAQRVSTGETSVENLTRSMVEMQSLKNDSIAEMKTIQTMDDMLETLLGMH